MQESPLSPLLLSTVLKVLTKARARKGNKRNIDRKEQIKLPLFPDDYIENSMESTKIEIKIPTTELSKVKCYRNQHSKANYISIY